MWGVRVAIPGWVTELDHWARDDTHNPPSRSLLTVVSSNERFLRPGGSPTRLDRCSVSRYTRSTNGKQASSTPPGFGSLVVRLFEVRNTGPATT